MNVAIDGPAGAGKSTIAKSIASEMGYIYVDTGALYRGIAYHMTGLGLKAGDETVIAGKVKPVSADIRYVDGTQHVFINDEDVTAYLRTEETGNMASVVARIPEVREALLGIQRKMAAQNDVVMDGRDIGTCVLPDAEVKIYLTASADVRAKRRYDELTDKGETADIDVIRQDIIDRDERDMSREIAPLKKADDAIEIDSSYLSIEEVKARIIGIIKDQLR
ncbi:MAG: (d)CMP kinase [Lachnospiraceae bacterium]|nr:(d)CMP kinase [Lachnospiraceae bacterium]